MCAPNGEIKVCPVQHAQTATTTGGVIGDVKADIEQVWNTYGKWAIYAGALVGGVMLYKSFK